MHLATLKTADGVTVAGVHRDATDPQSPDRYVDLAAVDPTLPRSMRELLAEPDGPARAAAALAAGVDAGRFVDGTLLPPVPDPGKVICVGLNYRDHAAETGDELPSEPVAFGKFSSAVTGPGFEILLPAASTQVDFEAELVAVIGTPGRRIDAADAMRHIAGYTCGNDVSARDWQKGRPGGQWLLGKTPDGFAPTGPHLVTADELTDPHELDIALRLNGEVMQSGNTREFIFGLPEIIAHLSRVMTLTPGDLIFTGTPAGVGAARKPPVWLKPGDVTEVEIDGLGVLRNTFVGE